MTRDLDHTDVTVVGGGRSGRAVAELLAGAGASVFLTEHGPPSNGLETVLDRAGVAYEFGGHSTRALEADVMVVSPGVPTQANVVQQALRAGLPVHSEIEVASWFCEAPIVAITGTNGKTTTTSLTGHVVRTALADDPEREVIVAGNIGYPFSDYVRDAGPEDVVVLEVSSFQLDHVETFRPAVSILLNITPDHLDRYNDDFDAYARAKHRIFQNQTESDTVVYNHDDERVRTAVAQSAANGGPQALGFSCSEALPAGAFVETRNGADAVVLQAGDRNEVLMPRADLALRGLHNLQNSMAAALAAVALNLPADAIRTGLSTFEGVPHRLETVRTLDDVLYVNDSKATNVNAVWHALQSFNRPVVLVAGGRDKGNDYSALVPLVQDRVRAVVALGESARTVKTELGTHADSCVMAGSMEDALTHARRLARPGDVVLLSPACSSFDMYTNYEERGDTFRRLVMNL